LIRKNAYFLAPFVIALMIGAYLLLTNEKGIFILYFAIERKSLIDNVFMWITRFGEIGVYGVFALLFLLIRFRYTLLIALLGFVNLVLSLALKTYFACPRPGHVYWMKEYDGEISYIPGLDVNVGTTSSFPSGHTLSAFSLYFFVALLLKNKQWGLPLFIIALLVGISRIVLTQHFLSDVYAGAICGVLIAMAVYALQRLIPISPDRLIDKNLRYYIGEKP